MFSPGIRNPQRSVLICIVIGLLSLASIAWGVLEMQAEGKETLGSGLKIGLALLPAMLAPLMALNFWGGMKVIAAIRRGENVIARWTVTAAELAEFAASNQTRNALGIAHYNDWSPPRDAPSSGIEVIFTADAVLVGDTYFGLSTSGIYRFSHVWLLSDSGPAVAFRTILTGANRFGTRTTVGELRIPISRIASAEATKVVAHFEQVRTGEVIANSDFYKRRIRIGLIGAPIFLAIAALGFVLQSTIGASEDFDPTILIAIGLIPGIGLLILAFAASVLDARQRRKR